MVPISEKQVLQGQDADERRLSPTIELAARMQELFNRMSPASQAAALEAVRRKLEFGGGK